MSSELARHGYSISPGTLYPLLHQIQQAGLLTSSQRTVDGRVLGSYQATAKGRRVLARLRQVVGVVAGEILAEQPGSSGRTP